MASAKRIQLSMQFLALSVPYKKTWTSLFSCSAFIELKKAFDTVDHKIILHYLDHYGFRGVVNKYISKRQNTTCGACAQSEAHYVS